MAFFGLTYLGGGDVFKEFTPANPISLGSIPDEKFLEAFDKYVVGDTPLALDLQCDGMEHVLRGDLHLILFDVLERNPSAEELDVFFTMTDYETSAAISRDEFLASVAVLKERCSNPKVPRAYTSHNQYTHDLKKHRRLEYEPMESLRRPIKESQIIGWQSMASPNRNQKRHTLNTTDVTRNEGIQPSNYFGMF
eukprot:jgi/Tetstr1/445945/TSEL_033574.t1